MEITWYTAMSMDGRLASADHSLAFLDLIGHRDDAEREFPDFIETIDAVLIGANTMRWLLDRGHGWPHGDLPTWLVTHDEQLDERIGSTDQPVVVHRGEVHQAVEQMREAGHRRVWLCGGGSIAGQLLRADLLDEVNATVAPAIVGSGPALAEGQNLPLRRFTLTQCEPIGGDAARLVWRRDR